MFRCACCLIVATAFAAIMYGDDISIPLEVGKILIQDAHFIRPDLDGKSIPELSFRIENHTPLPWWTIELQFQITGRCNREPRHWSVPATTSLGGDEDHVVGNVYRETDNSLEGKVDGCRTEAISAILVKAQNGARRIVGPEQAKKEAAEAARQKRLAAERQLKEDEQRAKAAEERSKIRAGCALIYQSTANKKVSDLTVKEATRVRGCQALGLYPPQ